MLKTKSEEALISDYSKKKLHCISQSYEELARLYYHIPIEQVSQEDRSEYLHQIQLQQNKDTFAKHLEEISGAVCEVADAVMHVGMLTQPHKRALVHFLKKHGIVVKEILLLEKELERYKHKISIVAKLGASKRYRVSELADLLSVFFDRRLVASKENAFTLSRSFDTYVFEEEPIYVTLTGVARATKAGEKISGDNYSIEEYEDGNLVMMISDGMGSGEEACRDSQSVIEFMERFLEAGFRKEKAFSMINAAISAQGCRMTTLDLCTVDLYRGEAEWIKAGSAASYRKRHGNVMEIEADALPLGSYATHECMTQTITLLDGDILIMMSDGVVDSISQSNELLMYEHGVKHVLEKMTSENPKEIANYLLQYAIRCQQGQIRDDMTVVVLGIWKNMNDDNNTKGKIPEERNADEYKSKQLCQRK